MTNKIRIESEADSLGLAEDKIYAVADSKEYIYDLSSINKIVLFTTDAGPIHDDMGLAIDVGNNDVISIMSEHKCYIPFLFNQIGKALPIDFQKILDASAYTGNGIFEIYVKEGVNPEAFIEREYLCLEAFECA